MIGQIKECKECGEVFAFRADKVFSLKTLFGFHFYCVEFEEHQTDCVNKRVVKLLGGFYVKEN